MWKNFSFPCMTIVGKLKFSPPVEKFKCLLSLSGDSILRGPVPRLDPPTNHLHLRTPGVPCKYGLASSAGGGKDRLNTILTFAIQNFHIFLKTSLSCDFQTVLFWDFRIDGLHTHGDNSQLKADSSLEVGPVDRRGSTGGLKVKGNSHCCYHDHHDYQDHQSHQDKV